MTRTPEARREQLAELALALPAELDRLAARFGPDVFAPSSGPGRALEEAIRGSGRGSVLDRIRGAEGGDLRTSALRELARASQKPEEAPDEMLDALELLSKSLVDAQGAADLAKLGLTAQLVGIEAREAEAQPRNGTIQIDRAVDTAELPPPAASATNVRIGKYELLRPLNAGGMGELWVARDTYTEREVALKLIKQDDDPDIETKIKRFRIESKAAAAATHPNVVTLFEAGTAEDGTHYIALELLVGYRELQQAFPAMRQCSFELAAKLMLQATEALRAIHSNGYVHRDVKPANILVNLDDSANPLLKLLDFGIAKKMVKTATKSTDGTSLTGNYAVGTPDYMPSEQWDNAELTAQSDFYSLGCVLYQLLTGTPPFCVLPKHLQDPNDPEARTRLLSPTQKAVAHMQWRPDPIETLRPDAPRELVELCQGMMAKKPSERPRDHDAIRQALLEYVDGEAQRTARAEQEAIKAKTWRRAAGTYAVILGVLFAGGLFVVIRRPWSGHSAPAPREADQARPEPKQDAPRREEPPKPDPAKVEEARQKQLVARLSELASKGKAIDALALAIDERLADPSGEVVSAYLASARKEADDADVGLDSATVRRHVRTVRDRASAIADRKVYIDEKDLQDLVAHADAADALASALSVGDPAKRLSALDDVIAQHRNTPAWPKAALKAIDEWSRGLDPVLDIGPSTSWTARMRPQRTTANEPTWGNDGGDLLLKDVASADDAEAWLFKEVSGAQRGWSLKVRFAPAAADARMAIALTPVFREDHKRARLLTWLPSTEQDAFELQDIAPGAEPARVGRTKLAKQPAHQVVVAILSKTVVIAVDGDLVYAGPPESESAPSPMLAFVVRKGEARISDIRLHR